MRNSLFLAQFAIAPLLFTSLMIILSQLVQFIFHRRQVKDIAYNPNFCAIAIIADALPLFFIVTSINNHGLVIDNMTIRHVSLGIPLTYSLAFVALFYSLFAAKQRQTRFVQGATAFFGASLILSTANLFISQVPGLDILTFVILGLKISCAIRVAVESLDYSIPRALFSFIGISMMAMLIATMLFTVDAVKTGSGDGPTELTNKIERLSE